MRIGSKAGSRKEPYLELVPDTGTLALKGERQRLQRKKGFKDLFGRIDHRVVADSLIDQGGRIPVGIGVALEVGRLGNHLGAQHVVDKRQPMVWMRRILEPEAEGPTSMDCCRRTATQPAFLACWR